MFTEHLLRSAAGTFREWFFYPGMLVHKAHARYPKVTIMILFLGWMGGLVLALLGGPSQYFLSAQSLVGFSACIASFFSGFSAVIVSTNPTIAQPYMPPYVDEGKSEVD